MGGGGGEADSCAPLRNDSQKGKGKSKGKGKGNANAKAKAKANANANAKAKANTGVSPLRFASVEMTGRWSGSGFRPYAAE